MITESAVEKLTALFFFVTGVSHIVQPRVWVRFFIILREKGEVGRFFNALVHFPLGAFIVAFHNVWHGVPLIVTLIGWGLTLKSAIYFLFPRHGLGNARHDFAGTIVAFRGGRRVRRSAGRGHFLSADLMGDGLPSGR